MQYLINQLNKVPNSPSGVEVYRSQSGDRSVHVDTQAGRAVIRVDAREAVLIRDEKGLWVPENNDWRGLAQVLDAQALAMAPFGF